LLEKSRYFYHFRFYDIPNKRLSDASLIINQYTYKASTNNYLGGEKMSSHQDKKHDCDKHKHKHKPKPKPKPKHDHCDKKEHKCEQKCDCKEKCHVCKKCDCKCKCKEKECKKKECNECKECDRKCKCKEKECKEKECNECKECDRKCKCKEKECKEKECKPVVSVVKECISIEFTVPHGKEQTVFSTNNNIIASGFISYDCGDARFITVRFYDGPNEVGNSIQVFQDSSVAFNLSGFNRISVTCPSNAPGTIPGFGDDCPGVCEGAINLILRFPLDFDNNI
jgi:hypothetical protein